jgi:3-oxoacyl-[acyl-carrier-protein] synthase II
VKKRRVFVTGLGVLSPIGCGQREFWRNLCDARLGTSEIRAFDTKGFDSHCGGEIHNFDPSHFLRRLAPESIGRTTQFAIAVARMACEDGQYAVDGSERVGICFGTTMGNQSVVELANDVWHAEKKELPISTSSYPLSLIAGRVALELGAHGPALVIPTACAAGNYAIGWGLDLIRSCRTDVVIAGGSDALSRGCYAIFNRLGAMAKDVCRPFDKNRSGMMVSEGAAALLLESEDHARHRGAKAYAELLGYGLSCDAFHPVAPLPDGAGAISAMQKALASAGVDVDSVSYISAHGTGTRTNDVAESKAIIKVLGKRAGDVPVSSIKSMIGHTMGAASAIEAAATVLAIHHRVLPPTANYSEADPECLTNVVPNQAQDAPELRIALSNAFAFGGNISAIALGAIEPCRS